MLSPSDFNNAVPQFTNGNYASNPINPQYVAEPDAENYNKGTEPLQTLPAQWWNWFINKFTARFNKVNIYVKNIFNELAQVLSIFNITPDGTEQTPTTSQLKTLFECCYPQYVKTTASLVGTATTVNGHPLSSNVTVTRSDLGLGTSATVNTGTAAGCIPTVGTALGTTDGQFLATDANGKLKPSGYSASSFRASSWTPALVECANKGKNGSSYSAFGSNAFNSTAFTTCTGTVTKVKVGSTEYSPSSGVVSLPAYPSTPAVVCCAKCNGSGTAFGIAAVCSTRTGGSITYVPYTGTDGCPLLTSNFLAYWNGAYSNTGSSNLRYYCGGAFGTAAKCNATDFRASNWIPSCVSCSHCSDYSEVSYLWRPIIYSSDMSTVVCCEVCLWNSTTTNMRICNKSKCGILASYFHYVNGAMCSSMQFIPAGTSSGLGSYWNCCSGSEFKCICIYMFK